MAAKSALRTFAGLIAVVMLTAAGWGSWERFHGTVVDAETGKPIPDAVVVFEWVKRHRLGMDGPEYVQNVQEVVTDAEGRFSVQASPGINWNPITYLYRLTVAVFSPSYEAADPAFMVVKGSDASSESTMETLATLESGAITRLRPLKPSSPRQEILSLHVLAHPEDARHRVPRLTQAIDEQRRRQGLKERYVPQLD